MLGYAARAAGNAFVVVDGREGTAYEETSPPVFGSTGAHIAYAAKRGGKWRLVIDASSRRSTISPIAIVFDGGSSADHRPAGQGVPADRG